MKNFFLLLLSLAVLGACKTKNPEIKLPALFSDHMVLQQQSETPFWGWSTPGSRIDITTGWGEKKTAMADKKGNWSVNIKTPKAGGPYTITFQQAKTVKKISDVYIGEVWLASGQSNMEMPVKGWGKDMPIDGSAEAIKSADIPQISMFTVKKAVSDIPKKDCVGEWNVSNPENTGDFSATAYFFAKNLYEKLNVPIGIIHSSWGGTPAEAWTPLSYITKIKGFKETEKVLKERKINQQKMAGWLKKLKKNDYETALKNHFKDSIHDQKYSSVSFDDSGWGKMELPAYWETKQLENFNGIVWFRKEFNITEGTDLKNLKLYLGRIDDMDDTYVNGKNVGHMLEKGFWDAERIYPLDNDILHPGKNTISIKVIDDFGGGGIYGTREIGFVNSKNDTIVKLSGLWKFKPVALILDEKMYEPKGKNDLSSLPKISNSLSQYNATALYNAMIAPLIPYRIKGAIWYQGESNVGRAKQYEELFPLMIKSWRNAWKLGDFPFYFVQIAPFTYKGRKATSAAELRFAQFLTLKVKNTGMVVTTDIGDVNNIHPSNKPEVGRRLSLWALNKTYGFDDIVYSGPLFKDVVFDKNKAIIHFTNTAGGLKTDGHKLHSFEIAGKDSVYYKADAKIDKNTVVVSSKKVSKPVFIRFGWRNDAVPNLFNSAGLPASPFKN